MVVALPAASEGVEIAPMQKEKIANNSEDLDKVKHPLASATCRFRDTKKNVPEKPIASVESGNQVSGIP